MLLPELNQYISEMGGADEKWMILGLWTLAAGISRPISGKIADNISRKSVMYFGVLVSILISLIYPLFYSVAAFLTLRLLHGFSTGFQPTGATALIADVIPKGKRGEAMGIFGVTFTLGFSLGQGVGSTVKALFTMDGLFVASGIMGVISLLLLTLVKEDKEIVRQYAKEQGNDTLVKKVIPKFSELIGLEVLQPSVVMFLTAALSGCYFLMIPDLSTHLGIENKGHFWLMYMGFTIVTRILAGHMTDKFGARINLYVACVFLALAAVLTGTAQSQAQLDFSAIFYGIGSGISSPALFAWTADLANPANKGRGMGTMFIALEVGILAGNFMAQKVYDNNAEQFADAYFVGAGLCVLALLFLIITSFIDRKRAI